jgi:PKD domain
MGAPVGHFRAVAVLVAGGCALAFPSGAEATTFCVSRPTCVSAGGTPELDIQSAFNAANSDAAPPSTVEIGPGTYGIGSLVFNKSSQLTVIGAGRGATILTTSTGGIALTGNSGDLITSLSLHGTSAAASQLLTLGGGTADGVDISLDAPGSDVVAVFGSGTVKRSSVTVTGNALATAIGFEVGPTTVEDTTLTAPEGLTSAGFTTMRRDRVIASNIGADCHSTCRFEDSLISMAAGSSDGLLIDCLGATADLAGNNLTIVGPASASVAARCGPGTGTATATIDSSILRGATAHALQASTTGVSSHAEIDPTYDDYDPSTDLVSGPGAALTDPGTGSVHADPRFVDDAGGDYRIRFDSPALDAGNPAALGLLDSSTDLLGQPRVVGGRRDIGALEYQRQVPVASVGPVPIFVITGQPVHFDATASTDPDPGDALSYSWSFDDGVTASTATVQHAFATAGTHAVHLTVTDPTGLSASASANVQVIALKLSGLTESHRTWVDGRRLATIGARRAKLPVGTTFTFKLNAGAPVRFAFTHTLPGAGARGAHGKCVRRTGASRRSPHCDLVLTDGTLRFKAAAGKNRVHFEGRLSRKHTLRPGRYGVAVTAADPAGHATAPLKLTFTIA